MFRSTYEASTADLSSIEKSKVFSPEVLRGTVSVYRSVDNSQLAEIAAQGAVIKNKLTNPLYEPYLPVELLLQKKAKELGLLFDHSTNTLAHPTTEGIFLKEESSASIIEMRVTPDDCIVCSCETYANIAVALVHHIESYDPEKQAEKYWKQSQTLAEFKKRLEAGEISEPENYEVLIPYNVPLTHIKLV